MTSTEHYHDFSALDATEHLKHALQHFFSDDRNKYKYSLAQRHYDGIKSTADFTDSKQLFKIIMGTDLVTNKLITSYKTSQGFRYLIKKDYFQQLQRMIRTAKRTQVRQDADRSTPNTTNKARSTTKDYFRKTSPFLEAMQTLTDTSDEETQSDTKKSTSPTLLPEPITTVPDNAPDDPDIDNEEESIRSDITQQAADLERNMISAMKDLRDPEKDEVNVDILTPLVTKILNTELKSVIETLKVQDSIMEAQTNHCRQQSKDLEELITETKHLHSNMRRQIDIVELKLKYIQRKADKYTLLMSDMDSSFKQHLDDVRNSTIKKASQTPEMDNEALHQMADKFKRRLTRLKNTTTKLFKQQENDNDLVHDRILRIEDNLKELQTSSTKLTRPKRLFSEDSTSTSDNTPALPKPEKPKSKTYIHSPQSHTQQHKYSRGPNMEYLRKNVNMTCSDQEQILEFYIKLRLAIAKGGIFIKPIEDISKKESIAQDTNSTSDDKEIQSNALYSLLSNENLSRTIL